MAELNRRTPANRSRRRPVAAMAAWTLTAVLSLPVMSADAPDNAPLKTETATLGGGCFWCLEAMFETLPGVKSVVSGYAGGKTENPTYKQVCEGETGHAEVVRIEFDPARITFERILDAFWDAHDPTTLNRQGNDVGTQYRSIILHATEAQRAAAEKSKAAAAKRFDAPLVTEIAPLTKFYPAEGYHQDYFKNNPRQPYCMMVVRPKLKHFEETQKTKKAAP
jgi:peptide-methionine (S)-S-oxide reductase